MRRWTAWVCVLVALAASGCGTLDAPQANGTRTAVSATAARLIAYTSCSQLLSKVKAEALSEVGPDGLPTPGAAFASSGVGTAVRHTSSVPATGAAMGVAGASSAGNDAAGTNQAASDAAPAYSMTNDQEQGVDEPDLVKTNGQLLVALRENPVGLQVASVGNTPRLRGFLSLGASSGSPSGMFLVGNDAVILAPSTGASPVPQTGTRGPASGGPNNSSQPGADLATPFSPTTDVTVVDLADPDHPVVAHSFVVRGAEVDARLIAGYVELVVTSTPNLPFVTPSDGSANASHQAFEANRVVVANSNVSQWLPSVTSEPSGVSTGPNCTSTLHTVGASGLDTVSVVPIAPGSSQPLPAVTVMGDATTVYASTSSLYVGTSPWSELRMMPAVGDALEPPSTGGTSGSAADPTARDTTEVHGFDLSDPTAPRYLGSEKCRER